MSQTRRPGSGFFGVVDERMDYDLVAKVADAHPEWNIVIVGPMAKVEASDLPQRANIHWLGGRDYSQLPSYTKSFDVCLMPFARNEATEYINPTKALEYMATAKPIVSTAVPDVVSNFASVVKIAEFARRVLDHVRSRRGRAGSGRGRARREDGQGQHLGRHRRETRRPHQRRVGEKAERAAEKNGTQTLTAAGCGCINATAQQF
jgi:glycosyltransferase involved in cell wall biosynthesis